MNLIAVIDVGAGNLHSVEKAVRHVAADNDKIIIATKPDDLQSATHIILPGVGAFADCMNGLNKVSGMREALEQKVLRNKTPFFGICVGMQMLFEQGHEHGISKGLGWFKGEVVPLSETIKISGEDSSRDSGRKTNTLKIPHMGWNELNIMKAHPYFDGIKQGDHVYFVHSFHCVPKEDIAVLTTRYGGEVVTAIARENIFATQFHPEKSQKTGLRILQNFLQMPHAA